MGNVLTRTPTAYEVRALHPVRGFTGVPSLRAANNQGSIPAASGWYTVDSKSQGKSWFLHSSPLGDAICVPNIFFEGECSDDETLA